MAESPASYASHRPRLCRWARVFATIATIATIAFSAFSAFSACARRAAIYGTDAPTSPLPSATASANTQTVPSGDTEVRTEDASPPKPEEANAQDAFNAPYGMRIVPAGPFTMGADAGGEADEHPAHAVTLDSFFLDVTEVTNEAYGACVAAKACREKDLEIASRNHAGPDKGFQKPRQPVVGVSWSDARAYCTFVGKRLPREAEFEKAARGTDGRRYPWGEEAPTPERAVFARDFGRETTDDVGAHPAGRGPYGHDDLGGNVWEWTYDEYDPVAYSRASAPLGRPGSCAEILATLGELRSKGTRGFTGSNPIPNECERVLRGGAFNYFATGLRATNRVHHPGRYRLVMSGFRCAKDVPRERTRM
jgi:formylglycine-generating enzyme required for sulfatase activity